MPPPGTPPPTTPRAAPPPVRVIVAAGTSAPTAAALLSEAVAESGRGAAVAVLFSEGGLELLRGDWPDALARAGVRLVLCSRSARGHGLDPATLPSTVLWSSLTSFLSDAGPDARLWTVFA